MLNKTDIETNQESKKFIINHDEDYYISLLDIAATIWKRKYLIILISFFITILSLAYSIGSILLPSDRSYLPNVYTPKASMLITSGSSNNSMSALLSSSGLSSLAGLAGFGGSGNSNQQLAIALTTSNTTLDQLDEKFDFVKHYKVEKPKKILVRSIISKNLMAKIDNESGLFTVSFTDTDPVFAKSVVDETVMILSRRFAQLSGSKALEQKALLENRLSEVEIAITDLEHKSKAFTIKYGVVKVEALATEQVTILARLRSELILKEMEIENYKVFARSNDPVLDQFKNERMGLINKIKEIETGVGPGSRVLPSQQQLPTIAFEYAKIERDLAVQTELFKILTQQYELAKFNAAGQEPIFQIVEMAEVPDMKSGPSRSKIVIISTLVGFFCAIITAFIVEAIGNMRNSPNQMARFKALSSKKGALK